MAWQFSPGLAVLCREEDGERRYAVQYVHSFCLTPPAPAVQKSDAGLGVPGRLRHLRRQAGLLQKQAARLLGVSESAYRDVELGRCKRLPRPIADKLAALYGVPVEGFLDEYNLFLYCGQEQQIRAYRQACGLSRKGFAMLTGLGESSVKAWETGSKVISRRCWEKLVGILRKSAPKCWHAK